MKHLKKFFKIVGWSLAGIVGTVLLYLLSAYLLSHLSTTKDPGTYNDVAIYILTNGVHTDIVVPVKNDQIDWSREVKFANTKSRDTTGNLLAFGWGDKGFYLNTPTWSQLKFSVAFKAATGLSSSAIHATFCRDLMEAPDCKKIMVSKAQYARLTTSIHHRVQVDKEGHLMPIPTTANYNNFDAFYEAKRRYNIFYTCNTWANNALKAAGQKACVWTPFDKGIFWIYRDGENAKGEVQRRNENTQKTMSF